MFVTTMSAKEQKTNETTKHFPLKIARQAHIIEEKCKGIYNITKKVELAYDVSKFTHCKLYPFLKNNLEGN